MIVDDGYAYFFGHEQLAPRALRACLAEDSSRQHAPGCQENGCTSLWAGD